MRPDQIIGTVLLNKEHQKLYYIYAVDRPIAPTPPRLYRNSVKGEIESAIGFSFLPVEEAGRVAPYEGDTWKYEIGGHILRCKPSVRRINGGGLCDIFHNEFEWSNDFEYTEINDFIQARDYSLELNQGIINNWLQQS